jgi:hypothetical protein
MPKVKEIAHHWWWASLDPEARAREALAFLGGNLRAFAAFVKELAGRPGVAPDFDPQAEIREFAARHRKLHAAWWAAVGRTANPMVTGRARFPVERNRRALEAERKALEAIEAHLKAAKRAAERRAFPHGGPGGPVRSGDPEAIAKLKARLLELEALKERMLLANRLYRQGKDEELVAMGFSSEQVKGWRYSSDYFRGGPPFKEFDLRSVRDRIQRARARLAELERAKDRGPTEASPVPGVRLVEDTERMRIQLVFDEKPPAEVRKLLKSNGFRWAPSKGAWQRHLNENGRRAAKRVLEGLAKAAAS